MGLLRNPITQNLAVLSSILLLLLHLCHVANCKPNTAVKIVQCNSGAYTSGDPFTVSLAHVLAELESVAPTRLGYDFHNISPYPNAFAYGHAACNQTLTISDCSACLAAAKTALIAACDGRIGARSVLYDCTVRYEQYPFDD
ncbi:hypothetical protein ABFS82_04G027000 [Erythranthe guttata]|uniref:Gnk2-homologous domain-containing protein n=1 Tax=Erythranthe guttata TaxID=4155 RepID=A0A022S5D7_ERYGU|nr:PREDICTED: antifungal protein ginkbilobin-2-like [Erythranthe guttata]EYU46595.1 hypothetical protein MIMGU_mgv1a015922mg [Erythranthe guttata]|eukprot:XP_012832490.1 PREDICTED: antifungal protein ginkbilobin-2-like [Erythranthe guttata]